MRAATTLTRARRRGRLGGCEQAALGQVARVREAGRLAGDDADPGAAVVPARHLFDAPVVEPRRRRSLVLGVDLGELAAGPHRRRQHPLQDVMVDHPPHATGGPSPVLVAVHVGPDAALPSSAVTRATGRAAQADMVVGDADTAAALRSGTVDAPARRG